MSKNIHPASYYRNARHDVIELLSVQETGNILEIGGGEFPTLKILSDRTIGECWGVDLIQPTEPPKHFVKDSIENPSVIEKLPRGHFDLVIMNDVLEHLWDTEVILMNIFSLLKVHGQLAVSVPNVRQLRFAAQVLFGGTFPRRPSGMFEGTHRRWFTKKDIVQALASSGFKVQIAINRGRLVPKMLESSLYGQLLGLHTLLVAERI